MNESIDYAVDVFDARAMKEYLPKATCRKLLATIEEGQPLDPAIAGDVAHAMKEWAIARGATHYTHWFQPMTGTTAEKHDAFLDVENGEPVMTFSGKNLVVGEPDASSFPSGGLRSTFEARGYTAWDPTSPAFIKRGDNGATLCIPTAFCSYSGEALDRKTPLLRSIQALQKATKRLMSCFGLPDDRVTVTLGVEQEYFLVDRKYFDRRPDLIQCGRTLFGAMPAKHQQLDDHYFGPIPRRVLNFMHEVERELWKLGIPAKTRHNEAAPAQFELAPIFEEQNLAVDHNMLVMDVLQAVAAKNGLVCLLHEKPYAGINGSGKHNNWSIAYGRRNLLNPGDNPEDNAIFLTVLCALIEAVDLHADLLRLAVASAGNDHRLGANEAPPAIVSMYLGDQLDAVIDALEKGAPSKGKKKNTLRLGADALPPLPRDATDRNRTSPFAFTGNKFEFRAPGSSQNSSGPNVVLNLIAAEAFDKMSDAISSFGQKGFHDRLQEHLQGILKAHKRVLFSGDGYTDDWLKEAARRGLPNCATTLESVDAFDKPENVALYEKYGVLNARELKSRHEIVLDDYRTRVRIEGSLALDMAATLILPAAKEEYAAALDAFVKAEAAGIVSGTACLKDDVVELGAGLDSLKNAINALKDALAGKDSARVLAAMASLRVSADKLEKRVADSRWPLPKYGDMLFKY